VQYCLYAFKLEMDLKRDRDQTVCADTFIHCNSENITEAKQENKFNRSGRLTSNSKMEAWLGNNEVERDGRAFRSDPLVHSLAHSSANLNLEFLSY